MRKIIKFLFSFLIILLLITILFCFSLFNAFSANTPTCNLPNPTIEKESSPKPTETNKDKIYNSTVASSTSHPPCKDTDTQPTEKIQESEPQPQPKPEIQVSDNIKTESFSGDDVNLMISNRYTKDNRKIVFLTFDDGPSTTVTPKILSTLDKYNIKATFFILGSMAGKNQESKSLIAKIHKSGHSIGNHTFSHEYSILYPNNRVNVASYFSEVEKTSNVLKGILGENFQTRITRMPGGYMSRVYYKDPNLNQFNETLRQKEMFSIDWNALDSDADGKKRNCSQLVSLTKSSIGNQSKVILLMHDTYEKEETAKALPQIIEYLKQRGFEFATISE